MYNWNGIDLMEKATGATLLLQIIVHIHKPKDQHISASSFFVVIKQNLEYSKMWLHSLLWVLEKTKVWAVGRIIKPNWSAHKLSFNSCKIFLEALGYEANSPICHIYHELWNIKCIGGKYSWLKEYLKLDFITFTVSVEMPIYIRLSIS